MYDKSDRLDSILTVRRNNSRGVEMPFNLGMPELVILFVIVLLIFGVGRLPEVGGALGRGIRDFRKGIMEPDSDSKPKQEPQEPAKHA